MFNGRRLIIATKHNKQQVIAPILEKALGVSCFVDENFDTDTLGTFSGEVERKDDAITTARNKCLLAMESSNCDLAIASEGSFGPHPTFHFIPANEELLLFIDKKNNLEIITRELSTKTNFNAKEIKTKNELKEFANQVNFPSHGLIAKNSQNNFNKIEKGILTWEKLDEVYHHFMKTSESIYLETDMRAMYNPTRMTVIEIATNNLINKINSRCPICFTPGFAITDFKKGLPCDQCKFPTRSVLSTIYSCKKCLHIIEEKFPNKKQTEDPMYCDICNP
jgi:hypothetical protein